MNKKMNNKGFSLVELIVVIAIMAILAVTLAPRLTQYIERARVANDQNVMTEIMTAAQVANTENPTISLASTSLGAATAADTVMFVVSDGGKKWTVNDDATDGFAPDTATANGKFLNTLASLLPNFKLQSSNLSTASTITISSDANGVITLTLDYGLASEPTNPVDITLVQ